MLEEYIKELSECSNAQERAEKFVELAHFQLSIIENCNGEVIYSSKESLKKGKYYFLGLNPGGEGFITIKKDLDHLLEKGDENSICDLDWNASKNEYDPGQSPLQLSIKYLFNDILKHEIHDVFATNLIFKTTNNSDSLNFGLAGLCWGVHLLALSIVQPEIIITCGNGKNKSAFSFIADIYSGDIESHPLAGTFCIKVSRIKILNHPILLIGLPHLSYFKIINNEKFRIKFLELIDNSKSLFEEGCKE